MKKLTLIVFLSYSVTSFSQNKLGIDNYKYIQAPTNTLSSFPTLPSSSVGALVSVTDSNGRAGWWNGGAWKFLAYTSDIAGSGSGLTGSGTTPQIAYWTSSTVLGNSNLYNGTNQIGINGTPGYTLDVKLSSGANTIHLSPGTTDNGGYWWTQSANNTYFSAGVANNGTNWIAKATSYSIGGFENAGFNVYTNTGATIGSSTIPVQILGLASTGAFTLQKYGIGTFTGTLAKGLAVTSSGAVIEYNPITSVSNSDGTLTISPTTGAVVASIALGHANTWLALQTFGTLTTTSTTKFTGLTAGASTDSLLTWNASTGQVNRIAQLIDTTNVTNGLTLTTISPTNRTISLGGLLTGATAIGSLSSTNNWNPGAAIPGSILSINPGTLNDNVTAASGTVTNAVSVGMTGSTLTATNTSITYTNAYTMYINFAPIAGTNVTIGKTYSLGTAGDVNFQSNGTIAGMIIGTPQETALSTLTLSNFRDVIFTGSTTTWTLPALGSSLGYKYYIKNAGSGNITLNSAGSDHLYDVSQVTSITISAGTARIIVAGSANWYVE